MVKGDDTFILKGPPASATLRAYLVMEKSLFTFSGRFDYAIDEKGRVMLPVSLRDELKKSDVADRLYLGFYPGTQFISLYPFERWQTLNETWKDESRFPSTALMLEAQRLFFANIEPVTLDKAGRILIPSVFRERADLSKEVAVIGVGSKMEVWNPKILAENELKSAELLQRLFQEQSGGEAGHRLPQW